MLHQSLDIAPVSRPGAAPSIGLLPTLDPPIARPPRHRAPRVRPQIYPYRCGGGETDDGLAAMASSRGFDATSRYRCAMLSNVTIRGVPPIAAAGVVWRSREARLRWRAGGGSYRATPEESGSVAGAPLGIIWRDPAGAFAPRAGLAGAPAPPPFGAFLEPLRGPPPQARHRKAA